MNAFYKNKLFIILLSIYVTYNSGFMLSTTNGLGIIFDLVFAIIFLIPVTVSFSRKDLKLVHYVLTGTIVFTLITFAIHGFNPTGAYLGIIFKSIVAFGIAKIYKFQEFVNFFLKCLTGITIISLIGHFLFFSGIIPANFQLVYNLNEVPYHVSFPFFGLVWLPNRNIGIFWEPGVFATFLIIGLVFEISYTQFKKISYLRVLLFIIAIITTESSAGYGLILLVIIIYLFRLTNQQKLRFRLMTYLMVVAPLIILILLYPWIFRMLNLDQIEAFAKLMPDEIINQSRYLALKHNISVFLQMPIFGVGFARAGELIRYVSDTSSSTFLMSVFGIPGILYTFFWIYSIMKSNITSKNISFIIMIIFLMIINKEPQYIILFSWIVLYYFLHHLTFKSQKVGMV